MGIDAWTRTPHERKYQQRSTKSTPKADQSLKDRIANRWEGEHHKCACGCGKPGTAFRDRKMYNAKCVGRGSGWEKSKLPGDRTPPQSWSRRRELNKRSKQLDRDDE